jgi:GNAT superfamily N-acetyltransferase
MAGEVARLWGGATMPHARRRGVYAAVLAERLHVAVEWGATLALVKGRIDTSAPILRRFGFRPHGREVTWELRREG